MISRIWHGWTTLENADAYERLLRTVIFPAIASKNVSGYRGIQLLRRPLGSEVEFITIMQFDSLDAVKQFAGEELYNTDHIESAINLPHPRINASSLNEFPPDTLFVVYCAGPHCNGTEKAAIRLARLGRPVKKMIGGITGWLDEGFSLV